MSKAIDAVRAGIRSLGADGALLFQPENRRYLCGFTGSTGYVLITGEQCLFATDSRYVVQAGRQCAGFQVHPLLADHTVFDLIRQLDIHTLAIEERFASYDFARKLRELARVDTLAGIDSHIGTVRQIKEDWEIARIRRACEITDRAFDHILTVIREGMTERDISLKLQSYLRGVPGVERTADHFIVASGERGSMPHGMASEKRLERGDLITMDFGCCYQGYYSDMTRTICLGSASDRQREIYRCVLEAQEKAIAALSPGKTGREIDRVARQHIEHCGFGAFFGHGLGHSFGLEIHEPPRLAQNAEGDIPLEPGMVITVEPGIYIEGFGGVRIEDNLLLTETGWENLTHSKKHLIEL